jgi:hypothetical protein
MSKVLKIINWVLTGINAVCVVAAIVKKFELSAILVTIICFLITLGCAISTSKER